MVLRHRVGLCLVAGVVAASVQVSGMPTLDFLAVRDLPADGAGVDLPAGTVHYLLNNNSAPYISNTGAVGIYARVDVNPDPAVRTSQDAIYYAPPGGSAELVTTIGSVAPDTLPADMVNVVDTGTGVILNSGGSMAFSVEVRDPMSTEDESVIYFGTPGNLTLAFREDTVLGPVAPETSVALTSLPRANSAGQLVVNDRMNLSASVTSDNDELILIGAPGSETVLVREGDVAPGFLPIDNVLIGDTQTTSHPSNASGVTVVRTSLGGVVNSNENSALIKGTPGSLFILAREGDAAPMIPGVMDATLPGNFSSTSTDLSINAGGEVGIVTTIAGTGVNSDNSAVVFFGPATTRGDFSLIAREDDTIPSAIGDQRFFNFDTPLCGRPGELVFWSSLKGTNGSGFEGIFRYFGGSLSLVVAQDDFVPLSANLGADTVFGSISSNIAINENGDLAFQAFVVPIGANSTVSPGFNDETVWVLRAGQTDPELVLQTGAFVSVAPSDTRQITDFSFRPGNAGMDGQGFGFNNNRQIALELNLDGSGSTNGILRLNVDPVVLDGACCTGGVCTIVSGADCTAGGGTYQGDSSTCTDTDAFGQTPGTVCCKPDTNGDGALAVGDVLDFLSFWSSNDPRGDYNRDGVFAVGDILDFLAYWGTGC